VRDSAICLEKQLIHTAQLNHYTNVTNAHGNHISKHTAITVWFKPFKHRVPGSSNIVIALVLRENVIRVYKLDITAGNKMTIKMDIIGQTGSAM